MLHPLTQHQPALNLGVNLMTVHGLILKIYMCHIVDFYKMFPFFRKGA